MVTNLCNDNIVQHIDGSHIGKLNPVSDEPLPHANPVQVEFERLIASPHDSDNAILSHPTRCVHAPTWSSHWPRALCQAASTRLLQSYAITTTHVCDLTAWLRHSFHHAPDPTYYQCPPYAPKPPEELRKKYLRNAVRFLNFQANTIRCQVLPLYEMSINDCTMPPVQWVRPSRLEYAALYHGKGKYSRRNGSGRSLLHTQRHNHLQLVLYDSDTNSLKHRLPPARFIAVLVVHQYSRRERICLCSSQVQCSLTVVKRDPC